MPEDFSDGLKDLLNGLLNKKPAERLGHNGAKDIMVRFWFQCNEEIAFN